MKTIAQLSYIPLETHNPREKVQELLEHLAQFDVQIEVGYLSTTIIGAPETVFEVVQELYKIMSTESSKFRFHVELLSPERD
ncbi:thiamine-binding protein [Balneola sp. MJW-20]|uniref:thiamine-binding protein n=1 Tax=Gracilimonas aurantiaca TaxID=3234185 RepID=UPI00346745F9